jgi:hypothetical protein
MQAFPLVREVSRSLSTADWKDYAEGFLGCNSDEHWPAGIVVAEQPNRCIVGLFSYHVRPCLRAGRVMAVGDLTAVAPFGREIVADQLLDGIAELARRYSAREMEVSLAQSSAWWANLFRKRGYILDDRRQLVWQSGMTTTAQ